MIVFEVSYLLLVNLALSLPVTQILVNMIRPDKFAVYWDSAWTWYPFRVHAQGVSVNGQSRSQQWQVDMPMASATISLMPLIFRTVKLSDVNGVDIQYFQRPRIKSDKDFVAALEYFPPIRDREINDANLAPKKKRKPWDIVLDDVHASGSHKLWVYQLNGTVEGELQADLNFQTQGGPFSASNGVVDLALKSLELNDGQDVLRKAVFKGEVEVAPVVFKKNKGKKFIPFLVADLQVDADVDSLDFLNLFLENFHGMKVGGVGGVYGRLRIDRGTLLPGTDLAVSARELSLSLMSHLAKGNGEIELDVGTDRPDALNLAIRFNTLSAFHEGDQSHLFSGEGLALTGSGKATMPLIRKGEPEFSTLAVVVPAVIVPDLSLYQRYVPKKWQFKLHGGEGELQAGAELTETAFHADLNLRSEGAEVGIKDYRFETDLEVGLNIDNPSFASATVDISGSYVRLDDSSLASKAAGESAAIQTSLVIRKGELELNLPELAEKDVDLNELSQVLRSYDLETLLSRADAELEVDGSMSDLGWITLLLKNSHNLAIGGSGKLAIHGLLDSGWPTEGTRAEILPEGLELRILDYVVQGEGLVRLEVTKGGDSPNVTLDMDVTEASFKRQGEERAFIEKVVVTLDALGRNLSYDGPSEELELRFQMPSAEVTDMSVFNQYLPENSPLLVLGGRADLTADIELTPEVAGGYVKLNAQALQASIDDQEISADLRVDIKLADGVPKNLDFDISGSSVLLDQVRVIGKQEGFDQSDWNVKLDLEKGRVVWKKPVSLQAEAGIEMKDTRPIVAMLANHREKHGWLEKMLTIENIQGEAVMNVAQDQIVIPYAFIGSDRFDVGAKGTIGGQTRNGVVYARVGKLKGLLKIKDGKRNFDIIRARKKFDEYTPVGVPVSE